MARTRYTEGDGSIERAREMRKAPTAAEKALWSILRGAALDGHKFRRQQRLGPFFGDFVCLELRLVVEADGETHAGAEAQAADTRRTRFLEREGYRVLRFTNVDILSNLDGVAQTIRAHLAPSPSHPASPGGPLPLPQGERSL